ncbi:MAG: Ppx/GppA phosphatase family protein [Chloroflexota bacterium]
MTERGRYKSAECLAVIDIGSNTVHLLVARSDGRGLSPLDDESRRLRLGADVSAEGRIGPEKSAAVAATVCEYVDRARSLGASGIHLLGTQALRAAANGPDLAQTIEQASGLPVRIISSVSEAHLGHLGATLDTPGERPHVVVDVGGGSTQVVHVDDEGNAQWTRSLALGSVTLPAQMPWQDPPLAQEREAAEEAVRKAVDAAGLTSASGSGPEYAVAIGGVARRLRRAGRLARGEPIALPWLERLASIAMEVPSEVLEVLGAARADDADMIRAGSTILREVMRALTLQSCLVSDYGIREGAILALARGQPLANDE